VIFNAYSAAADVTLPEGNWNIYVNGEKAGTEVLGNVEGTVTVEGISAMVLIKEAAPAPLPTGSKVSLPAVIAGAAAAVAAVGAAVFVLKKKKK